MGKLRHPSETLHQMNSQLLFVKLTVANRQLFVTAPFILFFFFPFPNLAPPWQYCHYVAGLVGIGLSRLFSASELEDSIVGQDTDLANSMGLFLQKTNIIRDYLEDQMEGREFWPREVRENLIKLLLLAVHFLGNDSSGWHLSAALWVQMWVQGDVTTHC